MTYNVFNYINPKVIDYLKESLRGLRIDKSVFTLNNTVKYTFYTILKITKIISRKLDVEVSFNTPKSA